MREHNCQLAGQHACTCAHRQARSEELVRSSATPPPLACVPSLGRQKPCSEAPCRLRDAQPAQHDPEAGHAPQREDLRGPPRGPPPPPRNARPEGRGGVLRGAAACLPLPEPQGHERRRHVDEQGGAESAADGADPVEAEPRHAGQADGKTHGGGGRRRVLRCVRRQAKELGRRGAEAPLKQREPGQHAEAQAHPRGERQGVCVAVVGQDQGLHRGTEGLHAHQGHDQEEQAREAEGRARHVPEALELAAAAGAFALTGLLQLMVEQRRVVVGGEGVGEHRHEEQALAEEPGKPRAGPAGHRSACFLEELWLPHGGPVEFTTGHVGAVDAADHHDCGEH
mmetsp:Transcript_95841/g.298531  ORF Transcript_95841/g.298531 Transcript_95841/m.298531 type:complete len:339 (-) Transcript_95841:673-1689(-)